MADIKKVKIITHNGNFHTDDIFAVATLLLFLGQKVETSIVRSRQENVIKSGDYIVDVGGIYDPDKNRFDHHQIGGGGVRENTIPYAAFGLVWKKYGKELCGSTEVAEKIDQEIIQPVDAIDNGFQIIEAKIKAVYPYDIGMFFDAFSPSWKEGNQNIDDIFIRLVSYAKDILNREILKHNDDLEASLIVEKIYRESGDKRLIIFDRYYPSWEVLSKFPEPLFTIFPRDDGKWSIEAIRDDDSSLTNRKNLPLSWSGKRDEELEQITGVSGALFCHTGRFIAVAKTKEAILKLAELALNS